MKTIGQLANQIKPEQLYSAALTASQTQIQLPLRKDPEGKKRISDAIIMFYNGLKTYGKQPDQLTEVTQLFLFVLRDYPVEKIVDAMAYYVKNWNEFPAPADIANIIDRGNKPPFDKAVYVTISKKFPDQRTKQEWDYMREYEQFILRG